MKLLDIFINLIKSEITGSKIDFDKEKLTKEDIQKLCSIAKFHDVSTILAGAFHSNNISVERELQEQIDRKVFSDINYIEKQRYEIENISQVLNDNEIPFIPLKGSVIREYYQQPYYRTSCDIDILVHQEDLERAKKLFCSKLGYSFKTKSEHDMTFITGSGVTIELHYMLFAYNVTDLEQDLLKNPWDNVINVEKFRYKFTDEFFYLFFIYHYKKHFFGSGCGIRHIIDLYIVNTKMNLKANDFKDNLEKIGLYTFSVYSEKLARVWFEDEQHDDITLAMEKFILESGIYGSSSKNVQIVKSKKNGTNSFFLSRLWLSSAELYSQFPNVKKSKILIPFYQIARWFKLLFSKDNKTRIERLKLANKTSDESIEDINKLFDSLKIK